MKNTEALIGCLGILCLAVVACYAFTGAVIVRAIGDPPPNIRGLKPDPTFKVKLVNRSSKEVAFLLDGVAETWVKPGQSQLMPKKYSFAVGDFVNILVGDDTKRETVRVTAGRDKIRVLEYPETAESKALPRDYHRW